MNRDYASIGKWCFDAHGITAPELPQSVAALRMEVIAKHAGRPSIIEIARDLAEGLDQLPENRRSAAQAFLVSRHGFGFDCFSNGDLLRLTKIIARGKIRNEKEHRAIVHALSDTTLDSALAARLQALLIAHEGNLGAA